MWEKMYQMKLGEKIGNYPNTNSEEILIRVPGGWVYIFGDMQGTTSVFIPFDNAHIVTGKQIGRAHV